MYKYPLKTFTRAWVHPRPSFCEVRSQPACKHPVGLVYSSLCDWSTKVNTTNKTQNRWLQRCRALRQHPLLSFQVKLTVYLKGEFLGLAVVAVLLQVTDGEFFQWKSPLHTKQQKVQSRFLGQKNTLSFIHLKHSLLHFPHYYALFEKTVLL